MTTHNVHGLPTPTFGPEVPFEEEGMEEFTTAEWIEIEGRRFTFDPKHGNYPGLMVEPYNSDGSLSEDIYYEIEEIEEGEEG